MTISEIAEQVQSAVRVGDALGKTDTQIRADVHDIVGHLSFGEMDQVRAHIASSVDADNAYTAGTTA